ncbi:DsbA family protein [Nocardioides ferulae]|uniref:DsbA family protein n=1 Tax=Nocardioides ferulae TaxID=2340821 RepID=UPI000EAB83C8|nr:DsbA family protein [Nocardioides ferulae]
MPERSTRKSPVIPLVIAAVAAVALLATLIGQLTGGDGDAGDEAAGPAAASSAEQGGGDDPLAGLARRQQDDPMAMGDVDAPVVLIAYSEFQCPFCGKFARDTAPVLEEKYVADGTLRIEWRDFPYLGPESTTAALAGRAAAAQDSFWEFHDAMYAEQLPPNSGNLDRDYVIGIAEQLGLDVEQFEADLDSAKIEQQVRDDFAEGQSIGVTGTPSFLVNGTPIVGAQPTEVFEQVIEDAAAS